MTKREGVSAPSLLFFGGSMFSFADSEGRQCTVDLPPGNGHAWFMGGVYRTENPEVAEFLRKVGGGIYELGTEANEEPAPQVVFTEKAVDSDGTKVTVPTFKTGKGKQRARTDIE